jgi:diacylglycerol O-acyltransferase / wax synthase
MATRTRLTALEAAFLDVERTGLPMHVAGLVLFEPMAGRPVTMRDLERLLASRLPRLPRFRQRVAGGLFGTGRGWMDGEGFELDAHLFHHRLPAPGSRSQLTALCARIHAETLPRDRPLWQMHLVDGLHGGRQALLVKAHHAITDGIAGIQLAELLFEGADPGHGAALRFAPHPKPSLMSLARAAMGVGFLAAGGPIAFPGPFNGRVGPERGFAMASFEMEDVRRLKRSLGGSVDDVLLALVAAGVSRYVEGQGLPRALRNMRAMLPVSTWESTGGAGHGNHVTSVFVDLPADTSDLAVLVRRIAASKSTLRSTHAAAGMAMLIESSGWLPAPAQASVQRIATSLPIANLVVSDVPGPEQPLFFLGRRITACHPMIPLPASVGLSVAAVSMGGRMSLGIVTDPNLVPKAQRLAAEIEAAIRPREALKASPRVLRPARPARRRAA